MPTRNEINKIVCAYCKDACRGKCPLFIESREECALLGRIELLIRQAERNVVQKVMEWCEGRHTTVYKVLFDFLDTLEADGGFDEKMKKFAGKMQEHFKEEVLGENSERDGIARDLRDVAGGISGRESFEIADYVIEELLEPLREENKQLRYEEKDWKTHFEMAEKLRLTWVDRWRKMREWAKFPSNYGQVLRDKLDELEGKTEIDEACFEEIVGIPRPHSVSKKEESKRDKIKDQVNKVYMGAIPGQGVEAVIDYIVLSLEPLRDELAGVKRARNFYQRQADKVSENWRELREWLELLKEHGGKINGVLIKMDGLEGKPPSAVPDDRITSEQAIKNIQRVLNLLPTFEEACRNIGENLKDLHVFWNEANDKPVESVEVPRSESQLSEEMKGKIESTIALCPTCGKPNLMINLPIQPELPDESYRYSGNDPIYFCKVLQHTQDQLIRYLKARKR